EGDGTRLSSLGVHEHWNNAADKQYSRNLGTGEGIELINSPNQSLPTCQIEVNTEYASAEGAGVYKKGMKVEVLLSPTVLDTGDGIRAVFDGWIGEGEGAYTGGDSAFTVILDDDIRETAVWKIQYMFTRDVYPLSGGRVDLEPSGDWFDEDAFVHVLATPESGYLWAGWSGDTVCTSNPVRIQVDEPIHLTAHFVVQSSMNKENIPDRFVLEQNIPNPFNPETVIMYDLPKSGIVTIEVFDLMGRKVRTLIREKMQPGTYQTVWDGRNDAGNMVSSGTYVYMMRCGAFQKRMKSVFLK
ncbi:hypothetical protein JW835_03480, partial [bacterium]